MPLSTRLSGVLDWLREGYPAGIPGKDYIPVLALLRRRLTEDEVRDIAHEIAHRSPNGSSADIGVSITGITDALPSEDDVERVERHLSQQHSWPLDSS